MAGRGRYGPCFIQLGWVGGNMEGGNLISMTKRIIERLPFSSTQQPESFFSECFYSGTLVHERNSFWKAVQEAICSNTGSRLRHT